MAGDLTSYYMQQARGVDDGGIYKSGRVQKGEGLGSFLSSLFRRVIPMFTSGAKAVGKEALKTGVHLLKDTLNGRPVKESFRSRVTEAGTNLTNKAADKISAMVGNGYKSRKRPRRAQSKAGRKRRKVGRPKKKRAKGVQNKTIRKRKTKTRQRTIFRDVFT